MSESKNAINSALGTGLNVLSFFDEIYERVENIKHKKLSAESYLRAYYFEILNNLEFLEIINMSRIKKEQVNSEIIQFLLKNLQTDIGVTILFTEFKDEKEKSSSLYSFLKDNGKIKNTKNLLVKTDKGKEEKVKTKTFYENVLQAVSFTVVKIEILKKLSRFSANDMEAIKDIRIEKRLVNITERFKMIKEKLDEMPGIQELAR